MIKLDIDLSSLSICGYCRRQGIERITIKAKMVNKVRKYVRMWVCYEHRKDFKIWNIPNSIQEIYEEVNRIHKMRYALVTREDWKTIRKIKWAFERSDKKKCPVCFHSVYSDKCWKCGFELSREYRLIQFLASKQGSPIKLRGNST